MFMLGRPVARVIVAGGILFAGIAAAAAAGAFAVGTCGAYGYAFDYSRIDAAEKEAMRKCTAKGCRVVTAMKRNCAAFAVDLKNACGAYGYASAARLGAGAEHGAPAVLRQWRQGMRHPRLCLRRQGLAFSIA